MYDLSVSWTPNPAAEAVIGYRVYDSGVEIGNVQAPQFTLIIQSYLSELVPVSIQVEAYNAAGTGLKSDPVSALTPPGQVTGVSATLTLSA